MQNHHLAATFVGLAALTLSSAPVLAEANNAAAQAKGDKPKVDLSHFEIDDENPEGNLPTAEEANLVALKFGAMVIELGARIDAARGRGDWAQAVKYDRAWVKLAPQRANAYSALCRDAEQLGKRDDAIQACANAIQKEGVVVDDFVRFVRLATHRPGGIDPVELEDARNAIEHLQQDDASRSIGYQLQCALALKQKDDVALEQCSTGLAKLAPDDPKSITYAWSLAIRKHDLARARELVEQAQKNQQMQGAVAQMETSTRELEAAPVESESALSSTKQPIVQWLIGLLAALVGAVYIARRIARAGSSA
jgi:tetratricopeptide (TPR) repeat protein